MAHARRSLPLVLLALVSCAGGDLALYVDVRTDFVPGVEFFEVRNELTAEGLDASSAVRSSVTSRARAGDDFIRGVRTGEMPIAGPGTYLLVTTLHAESGALVASRTTQVTVHERLAVTVLLTRSCQGVVCPRSGDPEGAIACFGGRCVPPTCTPEMLETCGPTECSSDAECGASVSCAQRICAGGACLDAPIPGACPSRHFCSPERGCVLLPGEECVPQAEVCNEVDDDCNDIVDDGFDLESDPLHCGACGRACGTSRTITSSCVRSACVLECEEGWADCNGDASDGCEVSLASPDACGACGTRCAGATPLCVRDAGGIASCVSSCPEGTTLCSGSCADTSSSLSHCGTCDRPCAPPGARAACEEGACVVAGCDADRADCNGSAADGCEVDLSSPSSCGSCALACPASLPYCVRASGSFACTNGCADGVLGGDETDADCGGPLCPACNVGQRCRGDGDCTGSLLCSGGVCAPCGECEPAGAQSEACGACGMRGRTCTPSCTWGAWSGCAGEGACTPAATEPGACGNCGSRTRTCTSSCAWGAWSACAGEGVCSPGAVETGSCGNCGTRTRTCTSSCAWGAWSGCTGEGVCATGAMESGSCGNCGTRTRTCNSSCAWGAWGACGGEGVCSPGAVGTGACGNCGTASRTCTSSCTWGPFGACTGEGVCAPGAVSGTGCPGPCMVRTCTASCTWPSTCTGCSSSCSSGNRCGLSCTSGYHPQSYSYSSGCGGSCCSNNQTYCARSCGSSFNSCGLSCPAGYHVQSYSYVSGCGGSCCSNNQSSCAIDSGTFNKCGIGCPSGWHAESYSYVSACGGSCCSNNQTSCAPNTGTSFYVCGIGCPSGYAASSYSYTSSCGGSCCSNNRTLCNRI